MIEFGTLTKDEAIRGIRRIGDIARGQCYLVGHTGVRSDQPPTLNAKPSIHPSGLLQWQAGEFDRIAVQSVRRGTPNCGQCDVTCDRCDEEFDRRTACGWTET